MKRVTALLLFVVMIFSASAVIVAADDPYVLPVEPDYRLALRTESKRGGDFRVFVSLDSGKEEGVTLIEFELNYDPETVELITDETDFDAEGAYHPACGLETKTIGSNGKPKFTGEWESLSFIVADEGRIKIKYMTTGADYAIATMGGMFVFDFRFISEDAELTVVEIPDDKIVLCDYGFVDQNAGGDVATVEYIPDYETMLARFVGDAPEGAAFAVSVDFGNESYGAGSTVTASASVDFFDGAEIGDLTVIEFVFRFDTDMLELITDETDFDGESAYHPGCSLETKTIGANGKPKFTSDWESISTVDAEKGEVKVKYVTTDADAAAGSGEAVFSFNLKVKEAEPGEEFGVWVPGGCKGCDYAFNSYDGAGSYAIATVAEISDIIVDPDTPLVLIKPEDCSEEPGFLKGIAPGTDFEELLEQIVNAGDCIVASNKTDAEGNPVIGTGAVITCGDYSYILVVIGDMDGDGQVRLTDYAMAKRAVLNTYETSEAQNLAGAISGGLVITLKDYAKIKRHVLGTYDLNKELAQ